MQRDEQRQRLLREPVSNLCLPGEVPGPSHPAQVSIKPLKSVIVGDPEHQEDGNGEHPRDATGIHRVVTVFSLMYLYHSHSLPPPLFHFCFSLSVILSLYNNRHLLFNKTLTLAHGVICTPIQADPFLIILISGSEQGARSSPVWGLLHVTARDLAAEGVLGVALGDTATFYGALGDTAAFYGALGDAGHCDMAQPRPAGVYKGHRALPCPVPGAPLAEQEAALGSLRVRRR